MGTGDQPGYQYATVVVGGVIGISWTALFLAHGLRVTFCDPLPDVAEWVRAGLARTPRRLRGWGCRWAI